MSFVKNMLPSPLFMIHVVGGLGIERLCVQDTVILSLRCSQSFSLSAWLLDLEHIQVPEETVLSDTFLPIAGMYITYKTYTAKDSFNIGG